MACVLYREANVLCTRNMRTKRLLCVLARPRFSPFCRAGGRPWIRAELLLREFMREIMLAIAHL